MCPVCLQNFDQAAMCPLDCGGNHFLCPTCVQQMATGLVPVTTDDQGPRGSLINYVDLPGCPECRRRFHLAPHVQDPLGLDNFPSNHPDPTHLPRYYYDATGGLTQQEVQTFIFDAAQDALAAVDDQQWRDYLVSVANSLDVDSLPNVDLNDDHIDEATATAMQAWIETADEFTTAMVGGGLPPSVQAFAAPIRGIITEGLNKKIGKFIQLAAQTGYDVGQAATDGFDRLMRQWAD
jgi:hypothetical protein